MRMWIAIFTLTPDMFEVGWEVNVRCVLHWSIGMNSSNALYHNLAVGTRSSQHCVNLYRAPGPEVCPNLSAVKNVLKRVY